MDAAKRIFIIDDDIYIGDMLDEMLTKKGYLTRRAYSGTEALLLLSSWQPDLVLLDLMLPGLAGEDLLPKLSGIPVIVVSAKLDTSIKVELLLGGAADYVTKPFDSQELLARIAVQLRNTGFSRADRSPLLFFDDITVDMQQHTVLIGETGVRLTRTDCVLSGAQAMAPAGRYAFRGGPYQKHASTVLH